MGLLHCITIALSSVDKSLAGVGSPSVDALKRISRHKMPHSPAATTKQTNNQTTSNSPHKNTGVVITLHPVSWSATNETLAVWH
jgi:hypothetical protein